MSQGDDTTKVVLLATFGALGVAICGCGMLILPIAIPNFVEMQFRAKRAECPANVDGIKTAVMAYEAVWDTYPELPPHPVPVEGLGKSPRPFSPDSDWKNLGWAPDGDVRGTYWVETRPGDFTVYGACDVDGDGVPAIYTATKSINTTVTTGNTVY